MGDQRQLLFGMYLDALDMNEVIERCHAALSTRKRLLLGVLNAAKIVSLHKDRMLRDSLMECDLLLADGQSVVWASKLLGRPLPERVAGIDIFERLLMLANSEGRSIALLGATPDVLQRLQVVIAARFPGLKIVCAQHGYYKPEEAASIAERIREFGSRHAVYRHDLAQEGNIPRHLRRYAECAGPARRRRVLRHHGGPDQESAGTLAESGYGMGIPRSSGAGAAVVAIFLHQCQLRQNDSDGIHASGARFHL